jgi:hypothetical protein
MMGSAPDVVVGGGAHLGRLSVARGVWGGEVVARWRSEAAAESGGRRE